MNEAINLLLFVVLWGLRVHWYLNEMVV